MFSHNSHKQLKYLPLLLFFVDSLSKDYNLGKSFLYLFAKRETLAKLLVGFSSHN